MIYLFEDKSEEVLSELFRFSLPESVKDRIVYAEGNGNLFGMAEGLLKSGETVLVFLDTIPANKSIRDIYISLRRLSKQYGYRLIVWNIICAEYYFITAFGKYRGMKAFAGTDDYNIVAEIKPYRNSGLIQTEEDRAFTKTFEKFCKLYMKKNGGECINTDPVFYSEDCTCNSDCTGESMSDKSTKYRSAYGCSLESEQITETLWKIHRELLSITNKAIEEYNRAGYLNVKAYPEIRILPFETI